MNAILKSDITAIRSDVQQVPATVQRKLTLEDIAAIRAAFPHIESLNDKGACIARKPLSDYVCYREDEQHKEGRLYISKDHRDTSLVETYEGKLSFHLSKKLSVIEVSVQEIAALNETGIGGGSAATEDEQLVMMQIIKEGARLQASDIHVQVRQDRTVVRFRIHGRVRTFWSSRTREEGEKWLNALYATMSLQQTDAALNYRKGASSILKPEFAANAGLDSARIEYRGMKGYMVAVLRLMYSDDSNHSLETVGLLDDVQMPLMKYLLARTHGIFIISGATGHGKSKTIQAFVERYAERRKQEISFLTVEDPTEYNIRGDAIVQTPLYSNRDEVDADKKAWVLAIKQLLRLDPDGIMPGELRDLPSALAAVEAALTGHFVVTTLHVYDATAILQRLRGMGVPDDMLFNPAVFIGLMNQSLVAKLCPDCSIPLTSLLDASGCAPEAAIERDILDRVNRTVGDLSGVRIRSYDGEDCTTCGSIGERGRTPVIEIVVPNAAYMERYQDKGSLAAKKHWVSHMDGFTKTQHVLRLIRAGIVDPTTAEQIVGPLDLETIELGEAIVGGSNV